jgi:anti-repressor protein
MNEMIKVEINQNSEQVVSARNLYDALGIVKRFSSWWEDQAARISLKDGIDYTPYLQVHPQNHQEMQDYLVPLNIATHLCMISGGENAWKIRDYFIDIEKRWNSPDQVIARALLMADKKIHLLTAQIEADKPKVEFFDQVAESKDAIDLGTAAKVLNMGIGRNRLFEVLRDRRILMNDNKPYQTYIDRGYFRVIEQKYTKPDGSTNISIKTLVYQRGLDYIRKVLTA